MAYPRCSPDSEDHSLGTQGNTALMPAYTSREPTNPPEIYDSLADQAKGTPVNSWDNSASYEPSLWPGSPEDDKRTLSSELPTAQAAPKLIPRLGFIYQETRKMDFAFCVRVNDDTASEDQRVWDGLQSPSQPT
jgi:hypothetical protein